MKKLYLTILLLVFAGLFSALQASATVVPPSDITFTFEQQPLFSEANFLPGQAVTRYVDVANNSSETKTIGIEAKNYSSCSSGCLSDQLNLVVGDGTKDLYAATLTEFFAAGQKKLSEVSAGNTTRYYFTITFVPSAGNEYQDKTVGFDITVGDFVKETIGGGGDTGGGGGSTGGGGGGGGVYFGGETDLLIFNEASEPVVSNQTNVTWQTNHAATSRVIYSAETESHIFQLDNPPNYGYAHSTTEDTNKTTSHTVNISGLLPGVTYYYRVVSHGSFAVSTEHSFTVPGVKAVQTESPEVGGNYATTQNSTQAVASTGGANTQNSTGNDSGGTQQNPEQGKETAKEAPVNFFLASLGELLGKINFCSVFLIIIIILIILILLPLSEKHDNESKQWIVSVITTIILVVIYSLICPSYFKILLVVTAVLFVLLLLSRYLKKSKNS